MTEPLDDIAGDIQLLFDLDIKIREWQAMYDELKRRIQARLGENEFGTVAGRRVVRWNEYTSRKLLIREVKKKFTEEQLADCYHEGKQRSFYLVHPE